MDHFLSLKYFSLAKIRSLLNLTQKIKKKPSAYRRALKDKYVGLIFEKPSLRTKTAFCIGAAQLGATAVYYSPVEIKLDEREKICDVSRTLSRFLDGVVLRTFLHRKISEFIRFSSIPVINGLSDLVHPSQAVADVFTISQCKGKIENLKVAYIGDGNNVCHSLMYALSILGGNLFIAAPKNYFPHSEILEEANSLARISKARITLTESAAEAAKNADVLYTDVWASMGKEKEVALRKEQFKDFQVNDELLSLAKKDCIVMHCLPAHRGEEITDSVIDGKNSVVFLQAENRLHTAKALLFSLLRR